MTPQARLKALAEILKEVMEAPTLPADRVLSSYVRKRRYIGSKDRRFLSNQLYTLLRNRGPLLFLKESFKGERESSEKEVLLYALFFLKQTFDEMMTACDGSLYHLKPLEIDEKTYLKNLSKDSPQDLPLWALLNYPFEIESLLEKSLGERTEENFISHMKMLMKEAPLDLRVNTLKASRDDILAWFDKEGIEAHPTFYSPVGIRLPIKIDLKENILFKEGKIEIQDEGSQLISFLMAPQKGERVVDFCAGAGGKTLGLAALMENKGTIIATDINPVRLQKAKERFRRSGIHMVETRLLENPDSDRWTKRQKEKFDRVLVDAPCSGSGTWRRNPDQKWKLKIKDIEELQNLQFKILSKASSLLKKGGYLVYATCSFFLEENEKIIERFLAAESSNFILEEASTYFEKSLPIFDGPFLKLQPNVTGTDGFFAALLKKI